MNHSLNRRNFLKSSGLATATIPAWFLEYRRSMAVTPPPLSANDRPALALIGCGGQGRGNASRAAKFADIVAVCDLDERRLTEALKSNPKAKKYTDFRLLLEKENIHGIINGTPDHWHTLINIAALKAGKDVYSEKPLTLTIDEGKRLVNVANQTKGILQTGSQQRSEERFHLACELVRNGRVGKLTDVLVNLPAGPRGGPFAKAAVPTELDWDVWQGQVASTDYVAEKCHGSFRYWWDYSGGTLTDWGAHHNDIALWGMGLDRSGPVTIEAKPRVEMIPGGYTAFSEYEVHYEYANGVKQVTQSVAENGPDGREFKKADPGKFLHGVKFTGTDGWIFVTRGRIEASQPEMLTTPLPTQAQRLYASSNHMGNFIDCMRSRRPPICDAEIGHRSVSVCHLGVIALRLKRKLQWDPVAEKFKEDNEANAMLSRTMRKPYNYNYFA
ncbi:MAG: Gfo/Idh/MocA family oxidoreductase [Verrucomicrobia bacterium]|nr:MAG: Gfo/Idh/MocA family oxidoreductase [Verrucomicrobiota bacterium]